jgi:hypothetical protein
MDGVKAAINQGEKVTLQNGRAVIFKDPEFFAVLAVSSHIIELFQSDEVKALQSEDSAVSGIAKLMATDKGKNLICALFGASSGEPPETFADMTLVDGVRCISAVKNAVNFDELKELFFAVVPKETWQNLQKK